MSSRCCRSTRAPVGEQREECGELRLFVAPHFVQVEQLADLRQRQPEPLAAQDQLEAHPLALAVHAGALLALRRDAGPRPRRSGSRASSARIRGRAPKWNTSRATAAWRHCGSIEACGRGRRLSRGPCDARSGCRASASAPNGSARAARYHRRMTSNSSPEPALREVPVRRPRRPDERSKSRRACIGCACRCRSRSIISTCGSSRSATATRSSTAVTATRRRARSGSGISRRRSRTDRSGGSSPRTAIPIISATRHGSPRISAAQLR